MKDNSLIKIEKLVLEVGELSEIYPKYLMDVYPMAVENTKLANTELVIETAPGIGKCKSCDFVYNLVENDNTCPLCSSKEFIVISGRDFLIKELHAY